MVAQSRPRSEFAIDQSNDPIWKAEIDNFEKEEPKEPVPVTKFCEG